MHLINMDCTSTPSSQGAKPGSHAQRNTPNRMSKSRPSVKAPGRRVCLRTLAFNSANWWHFDLHGCAYIRRCLQQKSAADDGIQRDLINDDAPVLGPVKRRKFGSVTAWTFADVSVLQTEKADCQLGLAKPTGPFQHKEFETCEPAIVRAALLLHPLAHHRATPQGC